MDMAAIRSTIMESIEKGIIEKGEPWIRDELGFPPQEEKKLLTPLPGRVFTGKHAQWLASGHKQIIVSAKSFEKYNDQQIYIVGEDGIHGIMVEGKPEGPFSSRVRERYRNLHQISASEWGAWWPDNGQFWIYQPKIIEQFTPPLAYRPPEHARTYIKQVVTGAMEET
jgi:hypothetical protein